jgi:hypothetical protein
MHMRRVVLIKWVPVELHTQSEKDNSRLAPVGSRFLGRPDCSLGTTQNMPPQLYTCCCEVSKIHS